jgi:hypothetical protein
VNRGEISNKIIEWSHRTDLAGQIDTFIDNTTDRLNNRLGKAYTLTGNSAENDISTAFPMIYIYGGLREMAIYTADAPAAASYDQLYNMEVDKLNITANAPGFTDDSVAILSETEQEIINAT